MNAETTRLTSAVQALPRHHHRILPCRHGPSPSTADGKNLHLDNAHRPSAITVRPDQTLDMEAYPASLEKARETKPHPTSNLSSGVWCRARPLPPPTAAQQFGWNEPMLPSTNSRMLGTGRPIRPSFVVLPGPRTTPRQPFSADPTSDSAARHTRWSSCFVPGAPKRPRHSPISSAALHPSPSSSHSYGCPLPEREQCPPTSIHDLGLDSPSPGRSQNLLQSSNAMCSAHHGLIFGRRQPAIASHRNWPHHTSLSIVLGISLPRCKPSETTLHDQQSAVDFPAYFPAAYGARARQLPTEPDEAAHAMLPLSALFMIPLDSSCVTG
ncbi:hypothetical protein LZ30DRAFT_767555, partial [Colletotrichum cereale]